MTIYTSGNLEKGNEIPSVLAITFTEKAAMEMRQRVGQKLLQLSEKDEEKKDLYHQFVHAPIFTIHGFCSQLLREYPMEGKVPLDFEIIDERDAGLLQEKVMDEVIRKMEQNPDAIHFFADVCNLSNRTKIAREGLALYKLIKNRNIKPVPPSKIDGEITKDDFLTLIHDIQEFSTCCRSNAKIVKYFKEDRKHLMDLEEPLEWFLEIKNILEHMGTSLQGKPEREEIDKKIAAFSAYGEGNNELFYHIVIELLQDFEEAYGRRKAEMGYVDFYDLIEKATLLLDHPEVGDEIKDSYRYIMVDEFQDTDPLQCQLIYKLSTKEKPYDHGNLFVVGDPKQSIYQFRGSDVTSFLNMVEDMKEHGAMVLEMQDNYRSTTDILSFTNKVFQDQMENYIPLFSGTGEEGTPPEMIIEDEFLEEERVGRYLLEARAQGFEFGDMALLFRSGTHIHLFEDAFKSLGIPVINHHSMNFYQSREILDFILLLQGLLYDESFYQIGACRTPYVGLSEEGIYAMIRKEPCPDNIDRLRYDGWRKAKMELEEILRKEELTEILEEVVLRFKIKSYLAKEDEFYIKRGNMEKFMDLASEFQEKKGGNIEEFIETMMDLVQQGEEGQYVPEGDVPGVHLMTIHGSKGLEFPLVILPEAGKKPSGRVGLFNINPQGRLGLREGYSQDYYLSNKMENQILEMEEEKRIHYVACTRAMKKLVFSGMEKVQEGSLGHTILQGSATLSPIEKTFPVSLVSPHPGDLIDGEDKIPLYQLPRPKTGRVKKFYSISEFLTYRENPLSYYLEYHLGIQVQREYESAMDRKGLSPLDIGNVYHKYMELSAGESITLNQVFEDLHIKPNQQDWGYLRKMIDHTFETYRDVEESIHEVEFYFPVGDKWFHGFVDEYRIGKEKREVWDFKTNAPSNNFDQLQHYYEPQILLYTMAMEHLFHEKTHEGVLYFASVGEKRVVDISEEKQKNLYQELQQFIKTVEDPDFENRMKEELSQVNISVKDGCILLS